MKTKVWLLPLLFVAFSCGEPSKEQIRERIDQSILSYLNDWVTLKSLTSYEVNTADFDLINANKLPSVAVKGNLSENEALYYTTTIVTKTDDNVVTLDTIHCTLDRSFNVIASTDRSTHKPYPRQK